MFYFIVSRLPIISSIEKGKFFRIFIIGTICYIILHAFLFSKYTMSIDIIQKYRSYLYYIWGADLILTGIIVKLFGNSENDLDEEIEEKPEIAYREIPKMNREEIIRRLAEIKKNEIELNSQPTSQSPFIKKDNMNIIKEVPKNVQQLEPVQEQEKEQEQQEQLQEQKNQQNKIEYSDTELPVYQSIQNNENHE